MGKRGGKRKKKRVQGDRRHKKGHESGPEATGLDQDQGGAAEVCSPAWNSLDEESLLDYAQNAAQGGESGEEVEVAKLLSYLNFSVIPCALEPCNLECQPHAQGPPTDVDLLSELTSATLHGEGVGLDDVDGRKRRENRKRASRRRPNKRAKKLRSSADASSMCLCEFVSEGSLPSGSQRGHNGGMNSGGCERCWDALGQGKAPARRKSKGQGERYNPLSHVGGSRLGRGTRRGGDNRSESTTPVNLLPSSVALQCLVNMECENGGGGEVGAGFSTDTSATGEVEMGLEPDDSDHTPPADLEPAGSLLPDELYDNESDLSETTTDSGCDGDDEESSVERLGCTLPRWWEREPPFVSSNEESDSDQEKFASILNGAFPHMSAATADKSQGSLRSLKERLSLSEFKHPGKFGIRANVKKKRCKPSQAGTSLTPAEVNSKIAGFVQNQSETELRFVLVSRAHCRTIAHLAAAYRLQCEAEQQRRRLPVASTRLKKTPFTRLASWAEVEPILKTHGSAELMFPFTRSHSMEVVQNGDGVVGGRAPVLDETNVGNRILQGMGWRPGMGLGPAGGGIQEPVRAYIRPRRSGLGF